MVQTKSPSQSDLIMECLRYMRGQWVSSYVIEDYLRVRGVRTIEGRYRKFPEYEYRLIEESV